MATNNWNRGCVFSLLVGVVCLTSAAQAGRPGWRQRKVDWLAGPGGHIKSISYPQGRSLPLLIGPDARKAGATRRRAPEPAPWLGLFSTDSNVPSNAATTVESPPIAGFTPWIAVVVTDARSDDFDWVAQTHTSVVGNYLTRNPETDFAIGLFDTGSSSHLLGYGSASRTGVYDANLLTSNTVELSGATSSILAQVSQPLGIFMDGLAAVDPNGATVDDSNMVGESNASVIVGEPPEPNQPDLPTTVGSPMSVYFATSIRNDRPVTVTYDGNDYTAPDIHFYGPNDPCVPTYANKIPLNLSPTGGADVEYLPDFQAILEFIFQPGSPSVIGGALQSLFFVSSVDLHKGTYGAIDKEHFILDTGAQITVIGSNVASRLGLDPANPDFQVDIEDATGTVTTQPGFYIDSLEIPALGGWLTFTDVPVVLLDVGSPEGGTLDGIIGMNLFVDFNLVLRGGGLLGQGPPSLEFERIPSHPAADIAPPGGDGKVDALDLAALAKAWLSTSDSPNWNADADIAPLGAPDGRVDFLDFAVLAEFWLTGVAH
jgi:Aspartyl protease/Dockerin type I domain